MELSSTCLYAAAFCSSSILLLTGGTMRSVPPLSEKKVLLLITNRQRLEMSFWKLPEVFVGPPARSKLKAGPMCALTDWVRAFGECVLTEQTAEKHSEVFALLLLLL